MKEHGMEVVLGTLLRAGVVIAAAVVIAGGAWLLANSKGRPPITHRFHAEPGELTSMTGIVRSLPHARPEIVIQFGLLLLIATPVARVVFSLALFALERDWTYVALTTIVLAILMYSLAFVSAAG